MGNVTLIGMPGSGKTTIGKALAQALDMEFLDSDREIERLHGGTLAQLIAVHHRQARLKHVLHVRAVGY